MTTPDQPTTEQLASFNQTHAAWSASLDVVIDTFRAELADGQNREISMAGLSQWLSATMDSGALAEHLAVAVGRLYDAHAAPAAAFRDGVAEGRRQATEGYEPMRAAVSGVKRLNRPMIEQLRRAAADTSSNWDVTATVYPPSARDLVALVDALLAVAEQPTEGWGREWCVRLPDGLLEPDDERYVRAHAQAEGPHGTVVSRLVGPWEPAEQAKPTCTCPQHDPACPVCPSPSWVTPEQDTEVVR